MQLQSSLIDGRNLFREKLSPIYDINEIDSIYSLVVENTLGYNKTSQLVKAHETVSEKHWLKILQILNRVINNEPIQHILGESEFYNLRFNINKNVLIPRQETELLVDLIIKENIGKSPRIIDIGSGSGCIAITLKKHLPNAQVTAVDISEEALVMAKKNALNNHVEINFIRTDILKNTFIQESFDIIVSNPPYVTESEKKLMQSNVLEFEPHLALFVPDNHALLFYNAICSFAQSYLAEDGSIWMEINEVLGKETAEIFEKNGFNNTSIINDLNHKNRFVKVW